MDNVEIDLKEIIAVLKRQRQLIFMTVVILVGLAFAYILSATPIYRSTTLLMVDNRGTNLLDSDARGEQQGQVLSARVDSEVEILRSQATALAVIQAKNLIQDPDFGPKLGWMEKMGMALGVADLSADGLRAMVGLSPKAQQTQDNLVASAINKLQNAVEIRRQGLTYLVEVSVSLPDGKRAAEIANAYAEVYLQRQVQGKSNSMLSSRDVLRREIDNAQMQMVAAEAGVNNFIENNLARLEKESGDPAIAQLRQKLEQVKAQQQDYTPRIASLEGAIAGKDWATTAASLGDAAIDELARQRDQLEKRLGGAAANSKQAVDLIAELEKLDNSITSTATARVTQLREELRSVGDREAEARDQLRNALLQSGISPEMLTELFNLQQSVTITRNQYQNLLSREQDLGTLANVQVADARVVSEALPPSSPAAPNRTRIFSAALAGGLILGLALAFLKEYYVGGIASASQLQNVLQAKVPMTVPQVDLSESALPSDTVITQPLSLYAETFRKLRAAIDMGLNRSGMAVATEGPRNGKVILITSALPAEGKSTTAVSLARTYAMAGANTLLMDADLRKPTIAMRMGVECEVGLFEYLSSGVQEPGRELKAVQDPLSKLTLLTAGKRSTVPTDQLLNSMPFRALMQVARDNFDVVIVDSPPLLPVVDTRYLAQYADAVVQVVRFITTTQSEAREAASQTQEMMREGAAFYAVLSHEERGSGRGGYYSKYGGYYGQDA